jgi:hypothetical protein
MLKYIAGAYCIVAAMLDDVYNRFLVSLFCYIIQHVRHVVVILFPDAGMIENPHWISKEIKH